MFQTVTDLHSTLSQHTEAINILGGYLDLFCSQGVRDPKPSKDAAYDLFLFHQAVGRSSYICISRARHSNTYPFNISSPSPPDCFTNRTVTVRPMRSQAQHSLCQSHQLHQPRGLTQSYSSLPCTRRLYSRGGHQFRGCALWRQWFERQDRNCDRLGMK